MTYDSSPITAIATAPGRGGIGVVRISGKDLGAMLQALFGSQQFKPRHATYIPFT
ncbi:MAG TPA: tRNA uridine-5-carboxymethylaminomethyl(34) synthesis GTPase MnmE, partial [Undibacterium sp.]|nr:tRNA uridine-5-carboxymethylaminomethyl(34) synthesis GTPase MnmE [Undibacterium sp.]